MNDVMIYVLVGFVVLACGMLFWVARLAMHAQAAHEALLEQLAAQSAVRTQSALAQTQAVAAPTQETLDTTLQEGQF